jgi:two-component system invasion response regulator UvrY
VTARIQIIIADTQFIAREGLKSILAAEPDLTIVAEAGDKQQMLQLVKKHRPEVVIIDYNNPGFYQAADIVEIKKNSPKTGVMVISSDHSRQNIFEVLEYGVKNFLTKECDRQEIIEAIRATARGEKFFCHKIIDLILEKHIQKNEVDCEPTLLSDRENEVITLIAVGLTNKQIGGKLNLSPHTISTHRKNIMRKLRVNTVSEITMYAFRLGLIK